LCFQLIDVTISSVGADLRKLESVRKISKLILLVLVLSAGIALDLAPIRVPAGVDKLYHFIGFALITVLTISTYISFFCKKNINLFLMSLLVFGGIFGGFSEFLQQFVALRDCSVSDWLANLLAVIIVVVFTFLKASKEKKNIESSESQFDVKDLPIIF